MLQSKLQPQIDLERQRGRSIVAYSQCKRVLSLKVLYFTVFFCDTLCSQYYHYVWLMGPENSTSSERDGMCIETTVDYTQAKSPAFLIDGLC